MHRVDNTFGFTKKKTEKRQSLSKVTGKVAYPDFFAPFDDSDSP